MRLPNLRFQKNLNHFTVSTIFRWVRVLVNTVLLCQQTEREKSWILLYLDLFARWNRLLQGYRFSLGWDLHSQEPTMIISTWDPCLSWSPEPYFPKLWDLAHNLSLYTACPSGVLKRGQCLSVQAQTVSQSCLHVADEGCIFNSCIFIVFLPWSYLNQEYNLGNLINK